MNETDESNTITVTTEQIQTVREKGRNARKITTEKLPIYMNGWHSIRLNHFRLSDSVSSPMSYE